MNRTTQHHHHHHHQPLLSSLVVRASDTDTDRGVADYEPGEFRRDHRSDRYSDDSGYRTRVGTGSPIRLRDADCRYSSDFDQSGGPPRSREFSGGRDPGRYRDSPPLYGRGRAGGGRPSGRVSDGPGYRHGPTRGDGMGRNNNPNLHPREGDWFCPDPSCNNLNFARREYCNNCKRSRGSPLRGYPGGPPPTSIQRRWFPGPALNLSPGRINGYRPPPRAWARDGPRNLGTGGPPPPPRYEGRFYDYNLRRDRVDYPEDDYRGRSRFPRPIPGDGGRDTFFNDKRGYDRRPPHSPPLTSAALGSRDRWRSPPPSRDLRERSRSPVKGPRDYGRHAQGRN